jgi:hypothetical protein
MYKVIDGPVYLREVDLKNKAIGKGLLRCILYI